MRSFIHVTVKEPGFHRWLSAPMTVRFLRDFHRHEFHIKVSIEVTDPDRELEFFTVQEAIREYIRAYGVVDYVNDSCETIAQRLLKSLPFDNIRSVSVYEDGENGATVES